MPVSHASMANAIRALAMDAVEKAKSGHPGLPMGAADIATVLFGGVLTYDAADPAWPNRDRFVLSAGHGSMLLYALLYLIGEPSVTVDELALFRQLDSKTPGHPEYGHTTGIETTTGPLGQGIATAVGMALAERMLNAEFGAIVDHRTYVLASDGDLMEGVSQEAIAIAGHLRLARLIVLYDDNDISIDGPTSVSDSVDQLARFRSAGWNAIRIDGHDPAAILAALQAAQKADRPSLIACKTTIGFGLPTRQGTQKAHSDPPGPEEIAGARRRLDWPHPPFVVPDEILAAWREAGRRGASTRAAWNETLAMMPAERRTEFVRRLRGELPAGLEGALQTYKQKLASEPIEIATRKASESLLKIMAPLVPELILGSADLTASTNNKVAATPAVTPDSYAGRFVHWGVREHGMAAAINGMSLYRGFIPSGATFLVFSDYARPALRLAALMRLRTIYLMTHDSIGLGEDGPTHQPVEHLAALRSIPNMRVLRPADQTEVLECWQLALANEHGPSILALTRQNLPTVRSSYCRENLCAFGAYDLSPPRGDNHAGAEVAIFASGSEVAIALAAQQLLDDVGVLSRVVSVPCIELFFDQDEDYRIKIIGNEPVKVGIEAAVRQGWDAIIGNTGIFIGMHSFGASAPYQKLYQRFGITAQNVVRAVQGMIEDNSAAHAP